MSFAGSRPSFSYEDYLRASAPSTSTFGATPTHQHSKGGSGLFGSSSAPPPRSGLSGSSHKCTPSLFGGCTTPSCQSCAHGSGSAGLGGAAPVAPPGAAKGASLFSASPPATGTPPVGFRFSAPVHPAAENPTVQSGSRGLFAGASTAADPSQKPQQAQLSLAAASAPPPLKPAPIATDTPVESAKDTKTGFSAFEVEMLRLTRDTNDLMKGMAEQVKRALQGAAAKPLQHDASSSSATVDKLVDVLHALSSASKVVIDPAIAETKPKDPVVEPVSSATPDKVHSKPLQFVADRLGASVTAAVPLSKPLNAMDAPTKETVLPKVVEPTVVLESLPSSSAASSTASTTATEDALPSPPVVEDMFAAKVDQWTAIFAAAGELRVLADYEHGISMIAALEKDISQLHYAKYLESLSKANGGGQAEDKVAGEVRKVREAQRDRSLVELGNMWKEAKTRVAKYKAEKGL
ncbi:hypothetical protein JCM6882_005304 [Rhodosporidiobolus microsporus]